MVCNIGCPRHCALCCCSKIVFYFSNIAYEESASCASSCNIDSLQHCACVRRFRQLVSHKPHAFYLLFIIESVIVRTQYYKTLSFCGPERLATKSNQNECNLAPLTLDRPHPSKRGPQLIAGF